MDWNSFFIRSCWCLCSFWLKETMNILKRELSSRDDFHRMLSSASHQIQAFRIENFSFVKCLDANAKATASKTMSWMDPRESFLPQNVRLQIVFNLFKPHKHNKWNEIAMTSLCNRQIEWTNWEWKERSSSKSRDDGDVGCARIIYGHLSKSISVEDKSQLEWMSERAAQWM